MDTKVEEKKEVNKPKLTNNENECNCNIPYYSYLDENEGEKFRNKLIEMGIIGKPVKNVD